MTNQRAGNCSRKTRNQKEMIFISSRITDRATKGEKGNRSKSIELNSSWLHAHRAAQQLGNTCTIPHCLYSIYFGNAFAQVISSLLPRSFRDVDWRDATNSVTNRCRSPTAGWRRRKSFRFLWLPFEGPKFKSTRRCDSPHIHLTELKAPSTIHFLLSISLRAIKKYYREDAFFNRNLLPYSKYNREQ